MVKNSKRKTINYLDNEEFHFALKAYLMKCDIIWDKAQKEYHKMVEHAKENDLELPGELKKNNPMIKWPRMPEFLGQCFWKIATKLNSAGNFAGYSYKDDMISDGIYDCVKNIKTFDYKKALFKVYSVDPETGKEKSLFQEPNRERLQKALKSSLDYDIDIEDLEKRIEPYFAIDLDYPGFVIKVSRNPFAYFTQTCYYASLRRIDKEKHQTNVKSKMVKNSGVLECFVNSDGHKHSDTPNETNSYLQFLLENQNQIDSANAGKPKRKVIKKTTRAYQQKMKELDERNKELEEQLIKE